MDNCNLTIINKDKKSNQRIFKALETYGVRVFEWLSLDNNFLLTWADENDNTDYWFVIKNKELIKQYLSGKKSLRELVLNRETLYAANNFGDKFTIINYARNIEGIGYYIPSSNSFIEEIIN